MGVEKIEEKHERPPRAQPDRCEENKDNDTQTDERGQREESAERGKAPEPRIERYRER